MRGLTLIVLVVCLVGVFAGRDRDRDYDREYKRERHERKHNKHRFEEEAKEALDHLEYKNEQIFRFEDDILEPEMAEDIEEEIQEEIEEEEENIKGYMNEINNPCVDLDCPLGMTCFVDSSMQPYCSCVDECFAEEDEDYFVCDTNNITYHSECEFYRQKCADETMADAELDYFGSCEEMKPCMEDEMEEFPLRMRDWFSKIMKQMAEWDEKDGGLTEPEKEVEEEAELDRLPYMRPSYWRFQKLDVDPLDGYLSFRELVDLRAPLQHLEHCTKPFLQRCDADNDGLIHLEEWADCLLLD
ncbi:SPARC-like [Glandiceps talaboti]